MSNPDELLQQGWRLHRAGQFHEAGQVIREAIAADPARAHAWECLGISCFEQGRFDEAMAAYQRAIEIDPQFASALNNLGNTLLAQDRFSEAIHCYDRALTISPNTFPFLKNRGLALSYAGRFAEALESYEQAILHEPNDAVIRKHIGILRLSLGDFSGGWPEYEWRWKAGDELPPLDRPLWDGSALYGKTILLLAEQGLGDMVQFVRYAPWLKQRYKCRILLFCPQLRELLSSCAGIDHWVDSPDTRNLPHFDVYSPLVHIPAALAHTADDFPAIIPYLAADEALVASWQCKLAGYDGLKIGIHWRGRWRPQFKVDPLRSIPLVEFAPLTKLSLVNLFSLQKDARDEELSSLPGIVDLGRMLDNSVGAFVETAAVLKNLDLLITCDTAIAHVAGALGVPVWVALCNVPDWRWGGAGETTAWYPTMRLFRQTAPGDWSSVMHKITQAVADLQRSIAT